ncbi:MAG: hypothetical protein ACRDJC_13570 [Thermomicrobiales bacterium]
MVQVPLNLPPTPAEENAQRIAHLKAAIADLRKREEQILAAPIKGHRGQSFTVAKAKQWAGALAWAIASEDARGSERHRRVRLRNKLLVYPVVAVLDFPIMLLITASVFNVDWSALW